MSAVTPAGWSTARLRFKAQVNPKASVQLDPNAFVTFLPMEAIGEGGSLELDRTRRVTDVSQGYTYFEEGDVSIAKITPCFENGKGAVMTGLVGGVGFGTTELIVLRPEEGIDPRFLYYLTQSNHFRLNGEAAMLGSGGQKRVPDLFVKDFATPWPQFEIQTAIASYLDAETKRIDGLIQEKESLGRLLAELRNSVVSDAIERGLDAVVELVPSGVPWVGPLPSHWKPKRLKHLLDGIEQGWSPQCDGRPAELHEWGVLKAGACNGGAFRVEEQKALLPDMAPDPSIEIRSGDVLMSRASGSVDLVGSVAYLRDVRPRLMLSDKIFRLRIDGSQETSAEWLALVFNTQNQRRQIASFVGGSEGLARNIAASAVRELWLPVPPPNEQRQIVEFVNCKAQAIDELIAFAAHEINVLRELRASTITDAVLGRMDVHRRMTA